MSLIDRHAVTITGNGTKPMVFVHGYGCDQNMWRLMAPCFEDTHKVVLYDQIGAGRSDLSAYDKVKYQNLEGYADDLIAICDELALGPAIVVAHSVSGTIALLAAKKRPELFENLVMVGPSPCYINDGNYVGGFDRSDIDDMLEFLQLNHVGWSSQMAPIIMGNPDRPELAEELEVSFCRTDPQIAKQFARATFLSDHRADLPQVQTPTLILQSDDDTIAPVSVGTYMQQNMPNAQMVMLRAQGHCPHISSAPLVSEAILDYLAH
jgi:sigma-B regulation protein RsbQ